MTDKKGFKRESERGKPNQNSVPIRTSGIGTRIREASSTVGGIKALSQMIRLSEAQLHRVVSGKNQPKVEDVAEIADVTGYSLAWLATGDVSCERTREAGAHYDVNRAAERTGAADISFDLDLLENVVVQIRRALSSRGVTLRPEVEGRLVRVAYSHMAAHPEDSAETTLTNLIDLAAYR